MREIYKGVKEGNQSQKVLELHRGCESGGICTTSDFVKKSEDNDLIILSDVDEIPDLKKLKVFNNKNYGVFSQRMFMYKLNLLNLNENNWHGSKICLRKNLKSPQWLRNLKFKKYPWNLFFS